MFWELIFLVTGIFQTIGSQWLYYQGAAHNFSFFTVAASYLGMAAVYFFPTITSSAPSTRRLSKNKLKYDPLVESKDKFPYLTVLSISLMDFIGNLFVTMGLFIIGSGVFKNQLIC